MGLWFMVDGFMVYGLWFIQNLEIIKNPTNHLITRILACPDWTHVRIQTKGQRPRQRLIY